MSRPNLLILMSDEHSRKVLGCYGHRYVRTPNLDRLAVQGTLFERAYATSPICVPARASFATGRYLYQMGFWDNADAYDGSVRSWHHALRDAGHPVVAIGKLHFKAAECDYGFTEQRIPMYIPNGTGDVLGLLREEVLERSAAHKLARLAGPGESDYTRYDRAIAREAIDWITTAGKRSATPWALFVSFVAPHFPLIAPREFFDLYDPRVLPLPKQYQVAERPRHAALDFYRETFTYDRYFEDDDSVRQALAAYMGLCSFVDHNVGQVLHALESAGLASTTTVMYTSDHGDNLGARGLWGKSTMYEESIGVPLILAQPGVQPGRRATSVVSHVDVYPFVLRHFGLAAGSDDVSLPGRALGQDVGERPVVAEYHATGSRNAFFMLRNQRYKLVYHVAGEHELYDLVGDPEELTNIARTPHGEAICAELVTHLRGFCDPEEVDRRAKQRQAELIALAGGRNAILNRADYGFSPVPPGVLADPASGRGSEG